MLNIPINHVEQGCVKNTKLDTKNQFDRKRKNCKWASPM